MTLTCASWEGHDRVLEVMTFLKTKIKEKVRFHALSQMLTVERNRTELVVRMHMPFPGLKNDRISQEYHAHFSLTG